MSAQPRWEQSEERFRPAEVPAQGTLADQDRNAAAIVTVIAMASIEAVLNTYQPGAGATIEVDNGTYLLFHNINIPAIDSGVTITGPATSGATSDAGVLVPMTAIMSCACTAAGRKLIEISHSETRATTFELEHFFVILS